MLFIPTTIFDMVWGVRYLQDARGLDYVSAVMRSATVPIGWIIGCPLLGLVSDRLGRRREVIIVSGVVLFACLAWILYGSPDVFPPYSVALVAGVASGAAMLPYTIIKEANPPRVSGTATGVINFLNFTFSALLGPVFARLLTTASGGDGPTTIEHYRTGFQPLLYGIALAIVLTFFLKETGTAARAPMPVIASTLMTQQTGTGKYEQLLARCRALDPVPTAVAHPCEETALAGAMEAAAKGLIVPILVGPIAKIKEVAAQHGIDLGRPDWLTRLTATRPRRRRSSSCASGRRKF